MAPVVGKELMDLFGGVPHDASQHGEAPRRRAGKTGRFLSATHCFAGGGKVYTGMIAAEAGGTGRQQKGTVAPKFAADLGGETVGVNLRCVFPTRETADWMIRLSLPKIFVKHERGYF